MAFRIWTATALSVPLSLLLLSFLGTTGGVGTPLVVLLVFFGLFFVGSGWLASQVVLRLMPSVLQEAGIWERNGDTTKAEKAYRKAMSLYNSFLISPGDRRRGMPALVSRVARMYAAQTDIQPAAGEFMEGYLHTYPTDGEIAENWLQTQEYKGGLEPRQQDLAARIGDAHRDRTDIQLILARLYLMAQRTDFPALQTYRRAMNSPRAQSSAMATSISGVFIQEGRCDEWALPVYLQAAEQQSPSEALRCGLAACLRWILPSGRNADLLHRTRTILGPIDEDTLARMSSGFVPPTGSYSQHENMETLGGTAGRPLLAVVTNGMRKTGAALGRIGHDLRTMVAESLQRSPGLRRTLIWGLIAGLGMLALVSLVNTVSYLTPTPAPEAPPVNPPPLVETTPPVKPMPYTLQVAAYLKPEHAEHYLGNLRQQSLDAHIVQAYGNEKTWYQVRIGHFPDKQAAREYGAGLKAKGLIEDFYVAKRPSP